jgi:hypothetical protein
VNLNDEILDTLYGYYMIAIRDMALAVDGTEAHIDAQRRASHTSCTVLALFGAEAADKLRLEGISEWERIRGVPFEGRESA